MTDEKEYMTDVTVSGLKCLRCQHAWIPRKAGVIPLTCPGCHSAYWSRKPIRPKKDVQPALVANEPTELT